MHCLHISSTEFNTSSDGGSCRVVALLCSAMLLDLICIYICKCILYVHLLLLCVHSKNSLRSRSRSAVLYLVVLALVGDSTG
jgi:hypothetical protein